MKYPSEWSSVLLSGALLTSMVLGMGFFFAIHSQAAEVFPAIADSEGKGWAKYTLLFGLLILGIIAASIYKEAVRQRARNGPYVPSIREFIGNSLRTYDVVIGLVGSPLIFALLLQQMPGTSLLGMAVIALQNGFASTTLIGAVVDGKNGPPEDSRSNDD